MATLLCVTCLFCVALSVSAEADTTPPEPPTQMMKVDATATTMTVAWTASPSADVVKYVVFYWETREVIGETTETTYVITDLTADTKYAFAVHAEDAAGNESAAQIMTASTADLTPPEPPTQITVTHATGTSITISWTASPSDDVAKYVIFNWETKEPLGATLGTAFSIEDLTEKTEYTFAVSAEDSSGNESSSQTITASTIDATAPEPPTQIEITDTEKTSLSLKWTASTSDDVVRYLVCIVNDNDDTIFDFVGATTETSYTLNDLTPGKTYTIAVFAMDMANNNSSEKIIKASTETIETEAPTEAPTAKPSDTNSPQPADINVENLPTIVIAAISVVAVAIIGIGVFAAYWFVIRKKK